MARSIANTPNGIRKLNTKVWDDNGHFAVKLYDTVVYDETATTITLNNGGWVTPTTTSRIHQALIHRGHSNRVNIKNGQMFCDGKPFDGNTFTIKKNIGEMCSVCGDKLAYHTDETPCEVA